MTMASCEYADEVPCKSNNYAFFDDVCANELINAVTVDQIINLSKFCTSIPLDFIENDPTDVLKFNKLLTRAKDKVGVYHLWVENSRCSDHKIYSMLCVYVGKGDILDRVKEHTKEKYENQGLLHLSFYECENRIAKYLEQLFLDIYDFPMNHKENKNSKNEKLYARWSSDRYNIGTEMEFLSDRYSK
ncbi:hypothetical protein [Solimicrobium silvestre]|uniref:Uncharacterized protein n=1 Tax=Solimicrobium silvestre TaxID=2099400 RepID=A0A2S9H375_9BURK|nr:hypothetical protein [Solimicrobium silvestre]PRC94316.1 hypothetical protein S2091_0937 [Solimicrobium silvestre]